MFCRTTCEITRGSGRIRGGHKDDVDALGEYATGGLRDDKDDRYEDSSSLDLASTGDANGYYVARNGVTSHTYVG